jgi:hypothetical protein
MSAQAGIAQQAAPAATQPPPVPSLAPAAASASSKPGAGAVVNLTGSENAKKPAAQPEKTQGEGFKVHGHWVLDLKNPDGTLVTHKEFENSLVQAYFDAGPSGDQILTALLSGNAVSGGPAIAFLYGLASPPSPANQCGLGLRLQQGSSICQLFTVAGSQFALNPGVVASSQTGLSGAASFAQGSVQWVLSGNFTVPAGSPSPINGVATLLSMCVAPNASFVEPLLWQGTSGDGTGTVSPAVCAPANSTAGKITAGALTFTVVPNGGLTVTGGQVITVTVTISFS